VSSGPPGIVSSGLALYWDLQVAGHRDGPQSDLASDDRTAGRRFEAGRVGDGRRIGIGHVGRAHGREPGGAGLRGGAQRFRGCVVEHVGDRPDGIAFAATEMAGQAE